MTRSTSRFDSLAQQWGAPLYRFALWLWGNTGKAERLVSLTLRRACRLEIPHEGNALPFLIELMIREVAPITLRYRGRPAALPAPPLSTDFPEGEMERLRLVVRRLPEEYRLPLLLQVLAGMEIPRIAAVLETSEASVATRLCRARQWLLKQETRVDRLPTAGRGGR